MNDMEKVIKGITHHKLGQCDMSGKLCPYWGESADCMEKMLGDALTLVKEQEQAMKENDGTISNLIMQIKGISQCYERIVRCKDCKNWIPGYITDQDDFIPPKCGKYQQMVGHSNDDFCSLAEKKEGG